MLCVVCCGTSCVVLGVFMCRFQAVPPSTCNKCRHSLSLPLSLSLTHTHTHTHTHTQNVFSARTYSFTETIHNFATSYLFPPPCNPHNPSSSYENGVTRLRSVYTSFTVFASNEPPHPRPEYTLDIHLIKTSNPRSISSRSRSASTSFIDLL